MRFPALFPMHNIDTNQDHPCQRYLGKHQPAIRTRSLLGSSRRWEQLWARNPIPPGDLPPNPSLGLLHECPPTLFILAFIPQNHLLLPFIFYSKISPSPHNPHAQSRSSNILPNLQRWVLLLSTSRSLRLQQLRPRRTRRP